MVKKVMTNFKEETLKAITESGHTLEDVMFIGSSDGKYRMDITKFIEKSNFTYDSGFGAQAIATDLIIYFKDNTYIHRNEYDGSEWWEYNVPKVYRETDKYLDFNILGNDRYMWRTVEEMNDKKYNECGYLREEN